MESFIRFIIEAVKPRESFNVSDAKGKAFEVLLGSHLHHGTKKNGQPNKFLDHYRDEDGKSPQEIHDYIKSELDKHQPGMYNQINTHAQQAAQHVRTQLAAAGHHTIDRAAWTSQKSDHKSFTGEDDPNSDADVMLHTNKGPVGLSLKYGETKDMNLRNNGLDSLEKMAKLKKGALSSIRDQHVDNVRNKIGIKTHQDYKAVRGSVEAKRAEQSALSAQRLMTKHISDGLSNNLDSDDLKQYVKDRIAPQTKFPHFRLHTRPTGDGSQAENHMSNMQDDADKLDSDFEDFRVKPHNGSNITARIEGKRKGSSSYEPVLDQSIKKGSGPLKGFASTTKAPFLSKQPKIASDNVKPISAPKATQDKKPVKPRKEATFGGAKWGE